MPSNMQNRRMYQFIQMAYEYVRSSSKDEIGGESEIFLSKLSQIHAERLASIFADRDPDYGGTIRDLLQIQATRSNIDIVTSRHDKIEWESDDDLQAYLDQINQDENTPSLDPAYGTYLPIHFFLDGGLKDLSWGIYISEIGVYRLAAKLKAGFEAASPLSARDPDYLTLAYQILLRHELEHFKVESFALNAELFLKRPIYVRYLNDVYAETYHSSDCLEEALANAAVLNSTTIRRLLESMYPGQEDIAGFGNYVVQQVFFDQQQEACYRNYRLKEGWPGAGSAGGEARREAMNYLCNQIIHGQTKPPKHELIPLYAYPPDNHFLRQEELVPIHIVRDVDGISFLRVPPPKKKNWEKLLRQLRYRQTARGKGDHQVWESDREGLPKVTINYKGNEVEWGSFKNTLQNIGMKIGEYQEWQRSGILPDKLR